MSPSGARKPFCHLLQLRLTWQCSARAEISGPTSTADAVAGSIRKTWSASDGMQ